MTIYRSIALLSILALLVGCPTDEPDDDATSDDDDATGDDDSTGDDDTSSGDDDTSGDDDSTEATDEDGDGWTVEDGDCDDGDPAVHPEAEEGCDGIDTDCDGGLGPEELDDDGDGTTECDGDCDDANADVGPQATEIACDYIDNDCDGQLHDEEIDDDGDGYDECSGDADDTDPAINPDATEIACDYIDNDGDGNLHPDEVDNDGDGWDECSGDCDDGNPGLNLDDGDGDGVDTCSGDCDDSDETSFPGATEVCDGLDNDCSGAPGPDEADLDGDGVMVCAGDCDDTESGVYPGAIEDCNGIDDDCDGYPGFGEVDSDGDGFMVCAGDCNDSDPDVSPGAVEQCNGVDDDCDGAPALDEIDGDGDGHMLCEPDCDDSNPDFYPGANELCDGLDGDCDGVVPGDESDLDGDGAATCGGDCDDTAPGLNIDDLDGDGWTTCDDDCDDGQPLANPGLNEVCNDWIDNDCDGTDNGCALDGTNSLAGAYARFLPQEAGSWSRSVSGGGDIDGDGSPDIVAGATSEDAGGANSGAVYLVYEFGPGDNDLDLADAKLIGENEGDYAGVALSSQGDVNGDGYADVLVGAWQWGNNGSGRAYLVDGPVYGDVDLGLSDAIFVGEAASDRAGRSVSAAGDVNGDGFDDVLIGAPASDPGLAAAGTAYLIYGPVAGTVDLSNADVKLTGEDIGDYAGYNVDIASDVDGDGLPDVLVGAYLNDGGGVDAGAAYLLHNPAAGTIGLSAAAARMYGEAAEDSAGTNVAGAGDLDGDGFHDVLVGAYASDRGGQESGAAFVFYGPLSGSLDLGLADAVFAGTGAGDLAGWSGCGVGDVDGDGYGDLLISGEHNDDAGEDAGAVYLMYGPVSGDISLVDADVTFLGEAIEDNAGTALSGAGDPNGDGYDDFLVVAPGNDDGATGAGAFYLILGAGL